MPRIQRGIVDHFIYHVINRGNGRQEVFHKDGDYKSFIDLRQSPYGAIDWQVKICKDLGLESTMRPRGRQCIGG